MKDFTKNQSKLALAIATELEKSGCNVGECIQVLMNNAAGLIGRHAPDPVAIERYCTALSKVLVQSAQGYHRLSDLQPKNFKS